MSASSTVDTVTDSASDLAHRAQGFATETALPAVSAAASAAAGALKPRLAAAADSARPVLEKAASRAQQTANDTVFPALQSAATTVADSAREYGQDLWERVAETEQAQELARRATLVAAGSKGEASKRWPLFAAGIGLGVLLGAILGRRTAATPPPQPSHPARRRSQPMKQRQKVLLSSGGATLGKVTPSTNTAALLEARDFLLHHRTDLDAAHAGFRWPAIEGPFNWATDYFDALGRDSDALALWIVEEDGTEDKLTYADLVRRSHQVATWLMGHGVAKGSRVMLMLGNRVELWESMLAVMKLGAIVLPTTTALQAADLADRLERAEVEFVITTASETEKFSTLPAVVGVCVDDAVEGWLDYRETISVSPREFTAVTVAADPLLLYFTSGTTSRPKLVEHTQISYPVGHLSTMYWIGAQPGDVHLTVASPGWAKHAWSCFFAPFLAQATVFIYNYTRFDAPSLLRVVRDAGVTTFCAPPTVWRMLIQADLSGGPGSLREVLAAGEPLNPEVITQIESAWGLTVRDGFGQTETTLQIGNTPGQPVVAGAMGRPLPGIPAVLIDPLTGLDAGEGELCLDLASTPLALMTGYQGDPQRAAESMAGGRYHTGDVASRAADGTITYIGRTDDVFKASDYKISPFELESVLVEHPAVVEAAVVPAPDPTRLAVPKAYLTLAAGWAADAATAQAVLQHARDRLAPYLRIRRIEFVTDLPKTVSGKIRRVDLREREAALFAGTEPPSGLEWRDESFTLT